MVAAARYLNVNPWELAEQPVFWLHAAEVSSYAEAHAEEMKSK